MRSSQGSRSTNGYPAMPSTGRDVARDVPAATLQGALEPKDAVAEYRDADGYTELRLIVWRDGMQVSSGCRILTSLAAVEPRAALRSYLRHYLRSLALWAYGYAEADALGIVPTAHDAAPGEPVDGLAVESSGPKEVVDRIRSVIFEDIAGNGLAAYARRESQL